METFESFWLIEGSDPEMLLILCALFMPSIVCVPLVLIALWLPEDDAASDPNYDRQLGADRPEGFGSDWRRAA
ncbi:MAG TPA: hypothetical protein VK148_10355 [Xanthobacteraceae bacterium]|nr:hypothetical protein [Xanthobacteraceae bacterium]